MGVADSAKLLSDQPHMRNIRFQLPCKPFSPFGNLKDDANTPS
jgi:hypothetical protein